jgi:hypothetical protein
MMFVEGRSREQQTIIREKRDYDLRSHNIVLTTLFQKGERIACLREEEEKGHSWTTHASLFAKWCIRYMYVLFFLVFWLRTVIRGATSTKLFARRWRDDLNAELVDGA